MRPRIRTIKPELWTDQTLQRQPLGARLTFIGLFSLADDEGRLEGDPVLLRSLIHPSDPKVNQRAFNDWLQGLEHAGRIRRYEVEGMPYIDIPRFKSHQRVDKPRPSVLPSYEDAQQVLFVNGHYAAESATSRE
jgi:hypothetical protein